MTSFGEHVDDYLRLRRALGFGGWFGRGCCGGGLLCQCVDADRRDGDDEGSGESAERVKRVARGGSRGRSAA
jgi:hypothetical protein